MVLVNGKFLFGVSTVSVHGHHRFGTVAVRNEVTYCFISLHTRR
jgi:hypothetical protein